MAIFSLYCHNGTISAYGSGGEKKLLSGYLRKLLVRLTVSNKYRAAVFSCRSRLDVGIRNEVVAIITNENCQALTPIVEKFVAKSVSISAGIDAYIVRIQSASCIRAPSDLRPFSLFSFRCRAEITVAFKHAIKNSSEKIVKRFKPLAPDTVFT
tara:strand:- start:150 stop:611 length:462 start_codon:yes stop_codon:yes gene_type:complete